MLQYNKTKHLFYFIAHKTTPLEITSYTIYTV